MRRLEKKLNWNYTKTLCTDLNNPRKQLLYDHLPPISRTIEVRWERHAGCWWWRKGVFINDVLLWTTTPNQFQPTSKHIHWSCTDTGVDECFFVRQLIFYIQSCILIWTFANTRTHYIYIHIYIYIYILSSTDRLCRYITTLQCPYDT